MSGMSSGPSILIVRLSAIGDVMMSTAAVRTLRRHMPDARITWVVESKAESILAGNPDVDEVVVWRREGLKGVLRLARELMRRKFDIAIDMQGLAKSGLVTVVSGARTRVGFRDVREFSWIFCNKRIKGTPGVTVMQRYLDILQGVGVQYDDLDGPMRLVISEEERLAADKVLESSGVSPGEPIVALVPATTRYYKFWTDAGWSELAKLLWKEMGLRGVFLGSRADTRMIEKIVAESESPAVNIAGSTTMKTAAAVVDRSRAIVTVDTALMHISLCLGKPTAAIFGPTSIWRNYAEHPNFRLVRRECTAVPCDKKPVCGNVDCITSVTPEDVISALRSLKIESHLEEVI